MIQKGLQIDKHGTKTIPTSETIVYLGETHLASLNETPLAAFLLPLREVTMLSREGGVDEAGRSLA